MNRSKGHAVHSIHRFGRHVMVVNGNHRSSAKHVRPGLVVLLIILLLGMFWQYGLIGGALRRYVLPRFLPYTLDQYGLIIQSMQAQSVPSPTASTRGLRVTGSQAYMTELLTRSPFPAWLVPPGLIKDGLEICMDWTPTKMAQTVSIPVVVRLDAAAGRLPQVRFRFSSAELNDLLSAEFSDDWNDTKSYFLGHYDLMQRIWFDTFTLRSLDMPRQWAEAPVQFLAQATGRLRYWFKDGFVDARWTANVQQLTVLFEFKPVVHDDGTGFDYSVKVQGLKMSAVRMAPWMEKRLGKSIRQSMERSLNKPRKKERMARRRLPSWLPLDVALDVELSDGEDDEPAMAPSIAVSPPGEIKR